jgi:hypothetical protein
MIVRDIYGNLHIISKKKCNNYVSYYNQIYQIKLQQFTQNRNK